MRLAIRSFAPTLRRLPYHVVRFESTHAAPPAAKPYRAPTEEERESRRKPEWQPDPVRRTRIGRFAAFLNPFAEPEPQKKVPEAAQEAPPAPDPERGRQAALRYVKEGVLDPKYQRASRLVQSLLIGLALTAGLTPYGLQQGISGSREEAATGTEAEIGKCGRGRQKRSLRQEGKQDCTMNNPQRPR